METKIDVRTKLNMTIEVRRACESDLPAIEHFIVEGYDELAYFKRPLRWAWQFAENPYLPIRTGLAPVWIALDNGVVIGQIALQGLKLCVDGEESLGGWIVDVMILPAYRGRGIGHLIQARVAQDIPLLLTLTMAEATRRLGAKCGAITLGPTWQFSRWIRPHALDLQRFAITRTARRPLLNRAARLAPRLGLTHIASGMLAPLLDIRDVAYRRKPFATRCEITEAECFGPEMDAFWRRARGSYRALCCRDAAFLNWRFGAAPDLTYRKFILRRAGAIVGYSVLRATLEVELRQGVIVDLFAERADENAYESLIRHALETFARNVATVECATSRPEIASLLRRLGFIKTRTLAPTIVVKDEERRYSLRRLKDDWFFSKADHDWDQVHLAQSH